ncbi:MAG: Flp pilus assembly protein CpaB [Actinomycetes bacterium]
MNRRVAAIVGAVILAVLAGVLVFLFARSAETRAVATEEPVTILVTTQPIAKGTTLQAAADAGALQQTQVPVRLRPAGAVDSVTAANGALVAVNDIPADQMVLEGSFAATVPESVPLEVPDGMVAVSVTLGDPAKVGTFLRPGSEIAIFDTQSPPADAATGESVRATRLLLDRVTVLAIGPITQAGEATATGDAWSNSLVTLAVTQIQAEKLIQAFQTGSPYMALLGANTSLKQTAGVSDADLFK